MTELTFPDIQLQLSCTVCGHGLLLRWLGKTEQADDDGREVRIMRAPCVACEQTYECRMRVPAADEFEIEAGPEEEEVSAAARVVQLQDFPTVFAFAPADPDDNKVTHRIAWWPL